MREIPLTQGQVAIVDDEDYEDLARFNWIAVKTRNSRTPFHAARFWYENGKQCSEFMHRRLLGLKPGSQQKSHHINGNGLDNRRSNLALGFKRPNSLGHLFAKTAPVESPTIKDICWAAGIFEGEGHCRAQNNCTYIQIAQHNEWLPARLTALFGGNYRKYLHNGKTRSKQDYYYTWFLSGPRARGFLMTIYTLLSPRRQLQARHALGGAK